MPTKKQIKKVNTYEPHANEDKNRDERPGPASYNLPRHFDPIHEMMEEGDEEFNMPRFRNVEGGKVYVDDNNDRFGLPIRPMKPVELYPGPGAYDTREKDMSEKYRELEADKMVNIAERDFKADILDSGHQKKVPGPAYYKNPTKEPKKISFLFNPAEEWV